VLLLAPAQRAPCCLGEAATPVSGLAGAQSAWTVPVATEES
jgi:hypothetical protein